MDVSSCQGPEGKTRRLKEKGHAQNRQTHRNNVSLYASRCHKSILVRQVIIIIIIIAKHGHFFVSTPWEATIPAHVFELNRNKKR